MHPTLALAIAALTPQLTAQSTPRPPEKASVERVVKGGVMGTEYRLTAIGAEPKSLDKALAAAVNELVRVEDLMTDWRSSPRLDLNLFDLNKRAGKGPTAVPPELAKIIGRGQALGELTQGAFDITFGAVGKLWDFKKKPPVIPDAAAIQRAQALVDFRRIVIDPDHSTVDLPAGFRIGLGGIAKGYGIDRAMRVLRKHGVQHAVVNVGGDMKVLGKKHGKPWDIGIAHPRDKERALAALHVSNTCVVTSGDYERCFTHEGRRYHHILDPRTGYPSQGCMTATVVAHNAEYADALATALCVLGPKAALELVAKLPRVEAIVVGMDGAVSASPGLTGSLVDGTGRSPEKPVRKSSR